MPTLALAAFCLAVVAPSFAGALTVGVDPGLDPAGGEVERALAPADQVLQPVRNAAAPVTDATREVSEPIRKAVEPVTDALTPVKDAVAPITDAVTKPVRDAVAPVTDAVTKPVPDAGAPITGADTDPARGLDGGGRGPATGSRPVTDRPAGPADPGVADRTLRPTSTDRRPPRAAADLAATATLPSPASPGDVLRDAAQTFRFPLLVAAAVALFLAVQSRLDRRDPKLAMTADDEELRFA